MLTCQYESKQTKLIDQGKTDIPCYNKYKKGTKFAPSKHFFSWRLKTSLSDFRFKIYEICCQSLLYRWSQLKNLWKGNSRTTLSLYSGSKGFLMQTIKVLIPNMTLSEHVMEKQILRKMLCQGRGQLKLVGPCKLWVSVVTSLLCIRVVEIFKKRSNSDCLHLVVVWPSEPYMHNTYQLRSKKGHLWMWQIGKSAKLNWILLER